MSSNDDTELVKVPKAAVGPIEELARLVKQYRSLSNAIVAIITGYILEGVFSIFSTIAGGVLLIFDFLVGALATAQELLVGVFGGFGVDILQALQGVVASVGVATLQAGPVGPIVGVGAALVLSYVMYRILTALFGLLVARI